MKTYQQSELEKLSTVQLKSILIELFDGNAGEILNGFREMGITKE